MKLHLPAGSAAAGDDPLLVTPEAAGWQRCGLTRRAPCARLARACSRAARTRSPCCRSRAAGARSRSRAGASSWSGRESVFARISDWAYVPIDAELRISSSGRLRARARLCACSEALRPRLRRGRGRPGRAARRGPVDEAARQLHGARGLRRRRQADLLRGADTRRQLVELSAAQARRHARVRGRQRGDLLLPRRPHRRGRVLRRRLRRASHLHRRPLDRRDRDRARRRRVPRAGGLPRPVRRGARLPALLPQRDGVRCGPAQARLHRRPAPALDPRHLGRHGTRPAPADDVCRGHRGGTR